ncbi:MAG: amino acid permease [Pirellulaceae bacterium]|nr:amino acid permease [Pirellulaceae bacterium]
MNSAGSDSSRVDETPPIVDGSGDNSSNPLGLLSATTLVAASMIGAGVYTTSGFTIGDLGSPWLVLLAWLIGGVIAICGAVCYGALAGEFTESGGEYLFLSRALHPVAGLMAGWVSLLAGFTGAIAFAATAFASYLFPDSPSWTSIAAISLVVLAAALHTIGVRPGARVQDAAVLLKLTLIAAFVVMALLTTDGWQGTKGVSSAGVKESTSAFSFALTFATSLMWISLSYSGFNAAVYVAGEVKQPERNVPRALLMGTLLVTVIYIVLNAIFVLAPSIESIRFQPDVATLAARSIGGAKFELFIRVVILFGLFTSVSALVMTGPRVYAKMADDGFLPRVFRFQGQVPIVAIWIQAVLAMLVISVSTLKQLLGYLGFTLSVSAALTVGLVFWLHCRESSKVRVPWFPIPPIIFVGGTLLTATLAAIATPAQAVAGLITIGFGLLYYPWYRMRSKKSDLH